MKILNIKNTNVKVDDSAVVDLLKYKWYILYFNKVPYVARSQYIETTIEGKEISKTILMHRQIMNVTDPDTLIDHKDRDTLNNQKDNLRLCNKTQNSYNSPKRPTYTDKHSSYRGVYWRRDTNKWCAQITKRKMYHLYVSLNEEECGYAYNVAAKILAKEFAYINPIKNLTEEQQNMVKKAVLKKLVSVGFGV